MNATTSAQATLSSVRDVYFVVVFNFIGGAVIG
jgi:hypothetical protein